VAPAAAPSMVKLIGVLVGGWAAVVCTVVRALVGTDEVTVRVLNTTGDAIEPQAATWGYTWFDVT
jgi:hypothetical protein